MTNTTNTPGNAPRGVLTDTVTPYTLGPFETNCYVVRAEGTSDCWIVDASWDAGTMLADIEAAGLTPRAILLTHAHVDHIAGLPELRAALPGVPVSIHAAEHGWLGDADLNLSRAFDGVGVTMPAPDAALEHGQELTLGADAWRVLHTPGHSPGGVSLYCEAHGVVIAGDTLFAGSIGRFDFPTSDGDQLLASIRERLYELPDDTRVLPGHGPETSIGAEKRTNPYARA